MQLDPSVIDVAGSRTASAGLAYALQGRAQVVSLDPEEGELHGTSRCS